MTLLAQAGTSATRHSHCICPERHRHSPATVLAWGWSPQLHPTPRTQEPTPSRPCSSARPCCRCNVLPQAGKSRRARRHHARTGALDAAIEKGEGSPARSHPSRGEALSHCLSAERCHEQAGHSGQRAAPGQAEPGSRGVPGRSRRLLLPRPQDFETGPSLSRPHRLRPLRASLAGSWRLHHHHGSAGLLSAGKVTALPRPCWHPGPGPGMQEAKPCLTSQLSPPGGTGIRQASAAGHTRHSQLPANLPGLAPAGGSAPPGGTAAPAAPRAASEGRTGTCSALLWLPDARPRGACLLRMDHGMAGSEGLSLASDRGITC